MPYTLPPQADPNWRVPPYTFRPGTASFQIAWGDLWQFLTRTAQDLYGHFQVLAYFADRS